LGIKDQDQKIAAFRSSYIKVRTKKQAGQLKLPGLFLFKAV
jgi:hypothetical protein